MFCTFISAVFPTDDQLRRYLAIDILQSRSWPFGVTWHSNSNKGGCGGIKLASFNSSSPKTSH